jgi:hypothetical protein
MNRNIDPELAVQTLVDILRLNKRKQLPIHEKLQPQIQYVASLPEAAGRIGFDAERGLLLLLEDDNRLVAS